MAYVVPTTRNSGDLGQVADYNILCNNDIELESRKDTSYVQFTSSVNIVATVEASSTTIVTAGAVSANGTDTYEIEFFCPFLAYAATAGQACSIGIFDSGTQIVRLVSGNNNAAAGLNVPLTAAYRLTPSNGSHTYSIRGFVSTGTVVATAGLGGVATTAPGYIRVRKVQ